MLLQLLTVAVALSVGQPQGTEAVVYGPEHLIRGRLTPDIALFALERDVFSGRLLAEVVGHDPVPCPAPEPPMVQVWVLKTDGTSLQPEGAPARRSMSGGPDNVCTYLWSIRFESVPRAELAGAVLKIGDRIFAKPVAPAATGVRSN
jgi:hypothetical protein